MNFQIRELLNQTQEIVERLDENVTLQDIINTLQLPNFGALLNSALAALPQNLANIANDGALQLLNGARLDQVLSSTINSVQNQVLSEAQKALNSLTDVVSQAASVVNNVANTVNNIASAVVSNQSSFYNTALSLQNTINSVQNNVTNVSSLDSIIRNTVNNVVKSISPGEVKKLREDKNFYNNILNTTVSTVNTKLEQKFISQAQEYVSGPASVRALNSLNLFAREKLNNFTLDGEGYYEVDVNMNTFTNKGSTATLDSVLVSSSNSVVKTATGRKQRSGKTCSVDNKKILLESIVIVPDVGTFFAADIIKNSASELLLYYDTEDEAKKIRSDINNPTRVRVKPPKSNISTGSNLGGGSGRTTPTQITSTIRGNFTKLV